MACHRNKFHSQLAIVLNIDLSPRKPVAIEVALGLEAIWTDIGADDEEIGIGSIQQGHCTVAHGRWNKWTFMNRCLRDWPSSEPNQPVPVVERG